ncbi:hypothetical protein [Geofilum rubicundum]|uniref:Uncharacterized protein n=1 Tax=Geofilum rubicundum JCM 15548 TaxID=1236989 RepID=A0A0E9M3E6_9BACT|nr:hypothetical protein [Geofilum rubicundum]GAO31695.1 hypothetical protein JCM15548_14084 [Geofilum rubicundum JCM 15548]
MTKKLARLTIIPSLLWFLTIGSGYSQCDQKSGDVAPLYFSYTYNTPISIGQMMMLEYWMVCDMPFEHADETCFFLEDWMLNGAPVLVYNENDLEDWMLGDILGVDIPDSEMREWMFGFEPLVEASLYRTDLTDNVEDWMLQYRISAQLFIQEAFMSITDWMLNNSFDEHESAMDIEDWMVDGLSMN